MLFQCRIARYFPGSVRYRLDLGARLRYNARRRMSSVSEKCRVVGSVPDWQTWCSVAKVATLPCDYVELRADALPAELSAEQVLAVRPAAPVLLTARHAAEGGLRAWTEEERLRVALQLLPMAAAVDWEVAMLPHATELVQAAKAAGVTLIASNHDFEKTPTLEQLLEREAAARAAGADIVKFAFRLHTAEDMMVGVELLRRATGPLAVMGMGALGPVSRLLYAQHGSCLVYGYLGDTPTAPGQWGAEQFRRALQQLSSI